MKQLLEKFMIIVACSVLLMHAILPHHHHDIATLAGWSCKNEVTCQQNEHPVPDQNIRIQHQCLQHTDSTCAIQDALSHLVISQRYEISFQTWAKALLSQCLAIQVTPLIDELFATTQLSYYLTDTLLPPSVALANNLFRGPPHC